MTEFVLSHQLPVLDQERGGEVVLAEKVHDWVSRGWGNNAVYTQLLE